MEMDKDKDKKKIIFLYSEDEFILPNLYVAYWYYNDDVYYISNVTQSSGEPKRLGDIYKNLEEYKNGVIEDFDNILKSLEKKRGFGDKFIVHKLILKFVKETNEKIATMIKSIDRKRKIKRIINYE